MSTTVRRVKERGGAGGKITALKPHKTLTPISEKDNARSCKKSTGKENPKPLSGTGILAVSQKPIIRPMPRIDKPVFSVKGESRSRWSTSSMPRGRSSSPSDFTRFLSDFRKDRPSRISVSDRSVKTLETDHVVSNGGKSMNRFGGLEKCQQKKAFLDSNGFSVVNLNGNLEKSGEKTLNNLRAIENCEEKDCSYSNTNSSENSLNGHVNDDLDSCKDKSFSYSSLKVPNGTRRVLQGCKEKANAISNLEDAAEATTNGHDLSSKGMGGKSLISFKDLDNSKEKGLKEEGKGVRVANKYPSKLHEKLAFLEGKVKRIASDIKQTKDMLDMNNPDSSKIILSDIQDKISGIEKAMGHVTNDTDGNLDSSKFDEKDNQRLKIVEKNQIKQEGHLKNSVKGLNREELEARLFPHHKLLRSRNSLSTSSGSSQNHQPHLPLASCDSKLEEKPLSPIDENPIALEFLASLNSKQSKVSTRDEHIGLEFCEIQEMDGTATSAAQDNSNMLVSEKRDAEIILTTNERLDEFDDQENRQNMIIQEETEDTSMDQLHEIGRKTSTGGWFVSEGESVLLAHDDGSCSFYDIANSEHWHNKHINTVFGTYSQILPTDGLSPFQEKAEYKPPAGVSPNIWGDCWLIRAPNADGCSGKYVVAASAGNSLDSGFCSWDFYTKDVRAFHIEDGITTSSSRTVLGPLPNIGMYRRNDSSTIIGNENRQWWYKPCGALIISTASCQKAVQIYDIRDGEQVMKWETQRPVLTMDYSSPLQWRNRGKVVVAETETISLWDVNSLNPQALLSIASSGRKITALHVNNTDAELGGGVRQRVSSSEAEGNDGVFCTQETINIMDFRLASGVGLKISKLGVNVQSVFSRGDFIFLGCTNVKSAANEQFHSQVQQFSLRKGRLVSTYALPESNFHFHCSAITQVWGSSTFVMGVCGLGLFVFDAFKDDGMLSFTADHGNTRKVTEIIGPDDLYSPSFDYLSSRALIISRDRPALWRHLS
ncbi:hypothetical protein HHK36_020450 [Tetracentron sinense]|uniref:At4g14310 8-bladed propeller domain-containing protein n=1 Tax=Tetracentron sinense TaxID=13715 RepID=A0A835D8D4_TETSI|nr:hypothetical protein HHK36_020450 [Tetracentron sinense]